MSFLNAQWHEQANGILHDNYTGYAIDAVDENTASFIIHTDSSHVYFTQSSGSQWDLIFSLYPEDIIDVSIIDDDKIWFCTALPASIYHSQNGGETWIGQFSDSTITTYFNYIEMFDENNGIAMGDGNENEGPAIILITTDGGANWISVNDSAFGGYSGDLWRRIDFIDINTGYFRESGINPNLLFKTEDGCSTWTSTTLPENRGQALKFYDENIGLVVHFRTYYRTLDGGLTWEEADRPDTNDPNWGMDVEYHPSDPSKVWFAGSDKVYFSSDSGSSWSVEFSGNGIRDMVFIDENTGWVLTDDGIFYKGELAIDDENPHPIKFKVHQPYPNPFNPTTTIQFNVAARHASQLHIFDITGRMVETLVESELPMGEHEIVWNASNHPSGVYFVRLQNGEFVETQKVVLMK